MGITSLSERAFSGQNPLGKLFYFFLVFLFFFPPETTSQVNRRYSKSPLWISGD
jgi:hypothetical protein